MLVIDAEGVLELLHVFLLRECRLMGLFRVNEGGGLSEPLLKVLPRYLQTLEDLALSHRGFLSPKLLLQLKELGFDLPLLLMLN